MRDDYFLVLAHPRRRSLAEEIRTEQNRVQKGMVVEFTSSALAQRIQRILIGVSARIVLFICSRRASQTVRLCNNVVNLFGYQHEQISRMSCACWNASSSHCSLRPTIIFREDHGLLVAERLSNAEDWASPKKTRVLPIEMCEAIWGTVTPRRP